MKNSNKKIGQIYDCYSEKDDIKLIQYTTIDGMRTFGIEKNSHVYRMTSLINAKEQVENWLDNYKDLNPYAVFIIFGLANGIYLEKLFRLYPNAVFIIYEPSVEIFKYYCKNCGKWNVLEEDNVYLGVGMKGKSFVYRMMLNFITTSSYRYTYWIVLPNYNNIWNENILEIYRQYYYFLNQIGMEARTKIKYGNNWAESYLKSFSDIITQYSVRDLFKSSKSIVNSDSVAIVVAAGPSLDKNVGELKRVKGKACIIAVDTALKPLHKRGIIPDIVITIDNKKPLSFFDTPEFKKIPLVMETNGNSDLIKIHNGKRFYASSGENFTDYLLEIVGKENDAIPTGGSVGNSAFFLALKMGFNKIIMVGHDLALTNGNIHAKGIHSIESENISNEKGVYRYVDGYYGGKVKTREDYHSYLKWFELQMECADELNVVNATEGGAKIHGMREMPLKDIIGEWCTPEIAFDINNVVDDIPQICNEEEQRIIWEYIRKLPQRLKRYRRRLNKGIDYYNILDRLKMEGKEDTEEFKYNFKEIKKINKWLSSIKENYLLSMYEGEYENSIEIGVYDIYKDINEEWKANINLGINTYKLYIKRIDDFLNDFSLLSVEKQI